MPSEWGEQQHFMKVLGLQDEEVFQKIPCLSDVVLPSSLAPFSLVRYRGMVQDVFEPEMYSAFVRELPAEAPEEAEGGLLRTTKYREYVEAGPGNVIHDLGNQGLGQRGACYCVPLPGETAWAKAQASTSAAPAPRRADENEAAGRPKRGRGDTEENDDATMEGEEHGKPVPLESLPCRPQRARTSKKPLCKDFQGGRQGIMPTADDFGLNFPLPWEEARGPAASKPCIVKTYDADAETLRLGDIVDVLGVLCINPELANLEEPLEAVFENDARHPSTSLVTRLHAIAVRKLPFYHPAFPLTPAWLSEERLAAVYQTNFSAPGAVAAVREAALAQLRPTLGGDALAAEYALLALLSRSFARQGEQLLGAWSLNFTHWPQDMEVAAFAAAASELVPRCVCLDVSCESLGRKKWKPTKDYAANRLVASQLQLAAGTLLVLDETVLGEGRLMPAGVTAIKTIGQLVTERTLACDFSAYDVKVPLELQIILASRGRSVVKDVDLALPLKPSSCVAAAQANAAESLAAVRLYLGLVTRSPKGLAISEELANKLAGDFVEARQQFQVPSSLCGLWLSLARAYCLSHGEAQLTESMWSNLLQLEKQRMQRCMEAGFLSAA